jgi:hypothetical protein
VTLAQPRAKLRSMNSIADEKAKAGALAKVVREMTERFQDVRVQLMGQLFHLFESPNRFGLPAFYTLNARAWKENPSGAFVNWHPNVSCEAFGG